MLLLPLRLCHPAPHASNGRQQRAQPLAHVPERKHAALKAPALDQLKVVEEGLESNRDLAMLVQERGIAAVQERLQQLRCQLPHSLPTGTA